MLIAALGSLHHVPVAQPMLLHGDFTPDHWLFDEQLRLSGIIDFGQVGGGGSPVHDIDQLLLHGEASGWAERLHGDWLRDGYGPASFWETLPQQRLREAINFHLACLPFEAAAHNTAALAQIVPRLRAMAEQIEQGAL